MKANELVKKSITIEEVYKSIELANKRGDYKMPIMTAQYVDDEVKLKLFNDGFKVYLGDWDGMMINVLIIEW